MMRCPLLLLCGLFFSFYLPSLIAQPVPISVVWSSIFAGCATLANMATAYSNVSTNNVMITVNCVDVGTWRNLVTDLSLPHPTYDIYVLDASDIGSAVEAQTLQELTSFIQNPDILSVDFFSVALEYYSEYPPNSGRYYGLPFQPDSQLLYYRTDIYQQHGMVPPSTLEILLQQVQYFQQIYGSGFAAWWCWLVGAPCNQANLYFINEFFWLFGGDVWNSDTYQIEGVLNSPQNADALRFVKALWDASSPNLTVSGQDAVEFFCNGGSPILLSWLSFAPSILSCQQVGFTAADVGFYPLPYLAATGIEQVQLGGMGMHLSVKSSPVVQQSALNFMQYMVAPTQQLFWASQGGYSVRKSVVSNPTFFLNAQGQFVLYNSVFAQTFSYAKQGIRTRIFNNITAAFGIQLLNTLAGSVPAEQTLSQTAQILQQLMNDAYPCGRVCIPLIFPDSHLTGLVLALAILCELLFASLLIALWVYSKNSIIKKSAPTFLVTAVIGGMLMVSSLFVAPELAISRPLTDFQCIVRTWLQTLGFAVAFAAIFVKTYRISVIFGKQLVSNRLYDCKLFQYFTGIVSVCLTYLIVWTLVSPPTTSVAIVGGSTLETEQQVVSCTTSSLHYINYSIQLVLLIGGSGLAYRVRNTPMDFHEAKYIGIAVYNWAVVFIFVLIGLGTTTDYNSHFAFESLAVLLTGPIAIGMLLVPKFTAIFQGKTSIYVLNTDHPLTKTPDNLNEAGGTQKGTPRQHTRKASISRSNQNAKGANHIIISSLKDGKVNSPVASVSASCSNIRASEIADARTDDEPSQNMNFGCSVTCVNSNNRRDESVSLPRRDESPSLRQTQLKIITSTVPSPAFVSSIPNSPTSACFSPKSPTPLMLIDRKTEAPEFEQT